MKVLRTLTALHSGSLPVVEAIVRMKLRDGWVWAGGVQTRILEEYSKFAFARGRCGVRRSFKIGMHLVSSRSSPTFWLQSIHSRDDNERRFDLLLRAMTVKQK